MFFQTGEAGGGILLGLVSKNDAFEGRLCVVETGLEVFSTLFHSLVPGDSAKNFTFFVWGGCQSLREPKLQKVLKTTKRVTSQGCGDFF